LSLLPIINTISFSALSNWQYCTWYFLLKNVKKIEPFEETIYSHWGTLIHRYLQLVLSGKMTPQKAGKNFTRTWIKFCKIYGKYIRKQIDYKKKDNPLMWGKNALSTILNIQEIFEEKFGNYKILKIEENLYLPTPQEYPQHFSGYIDVVIQLENGKIVIIDFKTCDSTYLFTKYKDKYKDYQLTLYKHFYSIKHKIDPDQIETYFVPVARKASKKQIEFIRVTSGPKKVQNALDWLLRALRAINNQIWIKNRMSCFKYGEGDPCVFYDSEFCSK